MNNSYYPIKGHQLCLYAVPSRMVQMSRLFSAWGRKSAFTNNHTFLTIPNGVPLNQWALLSTRLFRQPNYWRSAFYATCVAIHVDLTWPCGSIHTCLCAMHAASAFLPVGYKATWSSSGGEPSTRGVPPVPVPTLVIELILERRKLFLSNWPAFSFWFCFAF